MNAGRKILVVGGGGYVGPVLTEHLLGAGYGVRNMDLFLYATQEVLAPFDANPRFEMVQADHCDRARLAGALDGVTDVVILGGLVGDPITRKYPDAHRVINHDAILGLIDTLDGRGLDRVVFVSTCSNYGLVDGDALAGEDYPLKPLSLYAEAKVAVEQRLLALAGKVDYRPTILRFATAFGLAPRMRFDLTVNEFTREMYLGRELLVYDSHTWRPYCHLGDFCDVIGRVLEAAERDVAFQVFNAGGDTGNFTKQMIVDAILEFLPDAPIRYENKGQDTRNYRVDFAKIRTVLDFEPAYTVRDGISELIKALDDQRFDDADARPNFYGNYEIDYPVAG
ncbi:MAG: NAD(P)-dependent oxidoreductase [Rhodospirillales bacterium]|nr:NAD(P)-dependent oxidoreductase [Rhodospirillales bacterium]